jgi:hypothetical protein
MKLSYTEQKHLNKGVALFSITESGTTHRIRIQSGAANELGNWYTKCGKHLLGVSRDFYTDKICKRCEAWN